MPWGSRLLVCFDNSPFTSAIILKLRISAGSCLTASRKVLIKRATKQTQLGPGTNFSQTWVWPRRLERRSEIHITVQIVSLKTHNVKLQRNTFMFVMSSWWGKYGTPPSGVKKSPGTVKNKWGNFVPRSNDILFMAHRGPKLPRRACRKSFARTLRGKGEGVFVY